MNVSFTPTLSRFALTGVVIDIDQKSGHHPKAIYLQVEAGQTYRIKLHKRVWRDLVVCPAVGDRLWVMGERVYKPQKADYRYKADYIEVLSKAVSGAIAPDSALSVSSRPTSSKPKGKILVCQKSSCCRRGGKELWQTLEQTLAEENLQDHISLKSTGCMGQCKQGPVMVLAKKRYTQVKPKQVKPLLDTLNFDALQS